MQGCISLWSGETVKGRGTVRSLEHVERGLYIVSYKWGHVEKAYGKDREEAIPAYLDATELIPSACAHGVVVLRGGETEGGWGWAEFRCKQ